MRIIERSKFEPEFVTVPARLRILNDKKVDEIAESIKRIGQISPIILRSVDKGRDVILVTGAHRLAAALKLGLEDIDAVFVDGDEHELRLWEVSENLHRSELTPEERDQHVLEWERVVMGVEKEVSRHVTQNPAGGRPEGGNRKTARDTGTSEPTVRRAKKLDGLPQDIKEAADKAGLSRNAKLRIADAPDKPVALQDEIEKKRAPKAPKAGPAAPKTPPPVPEPEPVEPEDDEPSLFDDDPAAAARRRREVIEQLGDEDAIEGEAKAAGVSDDRLTLLRARAEKKGLRIRRRGSDYHLVDEESGSESTHESLDTIEGYLDSIEGKRAMAMSTACGMPISNNSAAWLAAHPGATMEDFERELPPALGACAVDQPPAPEPDAALEQGDEAAELFTRIVPALKAVTVDAVRELGEMFAGYMISRLERAAAA